MHRQLAKSRCLPILTIQCLLTYGSFYIQQQHLHGSILSAFYDSTQEEHITVHSIVDRPTQLATTTSTLLLCILLVVFRILLLLLKSHIRQSQFRCLPLPQCLRTLNPRRLIANIIPQPRCCVEL
jgi:hypothetical protein